MSNQLEATSSSAEKPLTLEYKHVLREWNLEAKANELGTSDIHSCVACGFSSLGWAFVAYQLVGHQQGITLPAMG